MKSFLYNKKIFVSIGYKVNGKNEKKNGKINGKINGKKYVICICIINKVF